MAEREMTAEDTARQEALCSVDIVARELGLDSIAAEQFLRRQQQTSIADGVSRAESWGQAMDQTHMNLEDQYLKRARAGGLDADQASDATETAASGAYAKVTDLAPYGAFMDRTIERVASDQAAEKDWREEQRPALAAAQARGEWVPDWYLAQERANIKEIQGAAAQMSNENFPLHEAYLSGRRDAYNSLRDELAAGNPDLKASLPPSIEMEEIKVRQVVEQQKEDRSLELAR